ncbi:MAG: hypothetical protein Q8M17_04280 [Actinomycetota bacterium]|nr:hypothetical protein [Actinomycetota bacterium]
MDIASPAGPSVIVIAERSLHDLLCGQGIEWVVQERQPTVGSMWDALSGGRLDQHSSILVFSDSLLAGTPGDESEVIETARAIVAMSNAGARIFVARWDDERAARLRSLVTESAELQGLDPAQATFVELPTTAGGRAVLQEMKDSLDAVVVFPAVLPPTVDGTLTREGHHPAARPTAGRPTLPPIGIPALTLPERETGYPASASMELLGRPKRPGQVTITVTSSKGGSGKSTASILLAGTIARASALAGSPLSVCLIDLDTRDGQVASLIGKFMPTALNIRVQPVWDEDRIRRNLVHASGLGIDTLLAPIRPRTADTVGPDFYRTIIHSLQRMYDVVITDTSVQYLDPLIANVALPEADEILFVTTLASTAVQGMARALREMTAPVDESGLGIPREKIGIIVNQSVANVGMDRDQVLAAGLGVPVVGVIPLATKDVLTATNLNRMHALLDHPLLGPAYNDLARACLPGREVAEWDGEDVESASASGDDDVELGARRRGLFRR